MTRSEKIHFAFFLLWHDIKWAAGKIKRLIWNRGIKLRWNRLWVRKDEFHRSLNMDIEAVLDMNPKQYRAYIYDLERRRHIAHERDLART